MLCRNITFILALAACCSALPVAVTASSGSVNKYGEEQMSGSPQLCERDETEGLPDERLYLFRMLHMGHKKPTNRPAIKQPSPLQGIGAGIKPPPGPIKLHPVAKH
ncbi:hypothetical protein NMY22_g3132 [Coprinellus aureogranulatus]|nr:hypothetical protein NMY22_g3132 [Coprinellus aureogranulatus]